MAVMTDALVVFVTAPSEEAAGRIARGVVERRLAACASLVPSIRSIYRWEGEIHDEKEILIVIKTKRESFDPLMEWIRSNHPYEVPEILALPVAAGLPAYLEWLEDDQREEPI
jgi:periplasmic divalent cation tolerance protein